MTRRAAVIGHPIAHSRSPAIFARLAVELDAELVYEARDIAPAELAATVSAARADGALVGWNVTLPHKEAIAAHLDGLADEARAVGAVNVVVARGGRLIGHNTDVAGVMHTLEVERADVVGQACLVFGAGGASRAVLHALGLLGAGDVFVVGSRAEALAAAFSVRFPRTRFQVGPAVSSPRLVVNATPLGMRGVDRTREGRRLDEVFAPLSAMSLDGALAFDLIYDPEPTPFLDRMEALGARTVGGLPMLIEQALETWALWQGELDDGTRSRLRAVLDAELRARRAGLADPRPIVLTGMMGAGKSTVGAALALRLGWHLCDTDREIERRAGCRISDIFAADGEAGFRALEREVVADAARRSATVIALGGGALLDEANAAVLAEARLVWLTAGHETLLARLGNAEDRPLLAGADRRARLQALLSAREPVYRRAQLHIATDGADPAELADKIRVHFAGPFGEAK